jgi:hypothetical protein
MGSRAAIQKLELPRDWPVKWIPEFAEPYLRGYVPVLERDASFAGYRFLAPGSPLRRPHAPAASAKARIASVAPRRTGAPSVGFFLGYLLDAAAFPFLNAAPPECLVFCSVEPVGGALHRRLVSAPASLLRGTAEYIGWLTHRPPRFEYYPDAPFALARRTGMQEWPAGMCEHWSRNFFTETLAWLVRSALVRRLSTSVKTTYKATQS